MSLIQLAEKALENNRHYDSFDGFYTKEEKEEILPELIKEKEKTLDFLQHGAKELGVDDRYVSYYAGTLTRIGETICKIEASEECPEDQTTSKGRRALIGLYERIEH